MVKLFLLKCRSNQEFVFTWVESFSPRKNILIFHVPNDVLTEVALIGSYLIHQIAKSYRGPCADPGGGRGRSGPNTLKSPLNWQKFTKKSWGQAPITPGAPFSSDHGSATGAYMPIRINFDLRLGQRRSRWANIKSVVAERFFGSLRLGRQKVVTHFTTIGHPFFFWRQYVHLEKWDGKSSPNGRF